MTAKATLIHVEIAALVAEAWATYAESGNPADEEVARAVTAAAMKPAKARTRQKRRLTQWERRRKSLRGEFALDLGQPFLGQIRAVR